MQFFVKSLIATSLSLAISSPVFADIEIGGDTNTPISSSENESLDDELILGQSAEGQGRITSGSVLDSVGGSFGLNAGSTGTLEVTGNGSAWNSAGDIYVGKGGEGMLSISDGASVTTGDVIYVGAGGKGQLSVTNGGTLNAENLNVSDLTLGAKEGSVMVSGAGSALNIADYISVGEKGEMVVDDQASVSTGMLYIHNGKLDITGGAKVNAGFMALFDSAHIAPGYVNVSGAGSVLQTDYLMVGTSNLTGSLTVADNATLISDTVQIGMLNQDDEISSVNIGSQKGQAATGAGYLAVGELILDSASSQLNFNHTGDAYQLDSHISGSGNINQLSGVTVLTADNSDFNGVTHISGGTLVSNQGLGGDVNILSGGTMIAGEHIGGSVFNAGVLSVGVAGADGAESASDMRRLAIYGDYTGDNGTLILDSVLGGDDSATDFLSIYGDTRGTTGLVVNNLGGSGAQTLNGIPIIKVGGTSEGEFIQQGRIAAGAFDYQLARAGSDWVLDSSLTPQPPPAGPSAPETVEPETPSQNVPDRPSNIQPEGETSDKPNLKTMAVRPEAGAYSTNLAAANTLFNTRLHDRLGETHYVDALTGRNEVTSLWMRHEGGHNRSRDNSGQLNTHANRYVMQLGGDIAQWSSTGADRVHLGVMGGYANQKSKTRNTVTGHAANGDINGYSAGLYGTWLQDNADNTGVYADTWLQYNWFNNAVSGDSLSAERYKSKGLTASVESGYTAKLADISKTDAVYLQPNAQAIWMGVKADDLRESNGTRINGKGDGNVQTRLGVRTFIKHQDGEQKFEPFVEANWLHNSRPFGTTLDGVEISQAGARDIGELKAGVEGQLNRNVNLWGNVAQQVGDKGYSDTAAMIGLKVSF